MIDFSIDWGQKRAFGTILSSTCSTCPHVLEPGAFSTKYSVLALAVIDARILTYGQPVQGLLSSLFLQGPMTSIVFL